MKPDTSDKCARNPNYRSWQTKTKAGYGILYGDLLLLCWGCNYLDCAYKTLGTRTRLLAQFTQGTNPGPTAQCFGSSSSSIFHYQLSDQVTTLFIFIQFSTLPIPPLSFWPSPPFLHCRTCFLSQRKQLFREGYQLIFLFPYTVKLRFVGRHLYLAITVPMTPFITVFSHCTLLSDTHTAPTTAQMNSGK